MPVPLSSPVMLIWMVLCIFVYDENESDEKKTIHLYLKERKIEKEEEKPETVREQKGKHRTIVTIVGANSKWEKFQKNYLVNRGS